MACSSRYKYYTSNKEYHLEYATSIYEMLKDANYRVELDDSDEKLSYKMRESQIRKIPITLILGQKEVDEKQLALDYLVAQKLLQ